MSRVKTGVVGVVFLLLGIVLFMLVVPTVKTTELGLWEYAWAVVIIFAICMGFGSVMVTILDEEEASASPFPADTEKP